MWVSRCECGRRLQSEGGRLKIHQAELNAKGRVRMQLCIQVKLRTIPDLIQTTVPSAFEFPARTEDFPRARIMFIEETKDVRLGC